MSVTKLVSYCVNRCCVVRCGVQQGHSSVPQSSGLCSEGSVAPPRGQEVKQSVGGVGGVPQDAARSMLPAPPLDICDGRKWSPSDALGSFHHPLQSLYCILYSIIAKGSEQCDHKVLLVSPILSLRCQPRVNHTDLWELQK